MTLLEIASMTEEEARAHFERIRWPDGPVCPHCGSMNFTRLQGKSHRPGLIQCNNGDCRQSYTVTVNTVMERSKISLRKWATAFHLMSSSKKGVSAKQLQRELGLGSYETALHLAHRVRWAMNQTVGNLGGVVEGDEAYIGANAKNLHQSQKTGDKSRFGRNTLKSPVAVLVERDGRAVATHVDRVDQRTLTENIKRHVRKDATVVTDEWSGYRKVSQRQRHEVIRHKDGQYVREALDGLKVTTNLAECFISLVKRGHYGIHHSYSRHHMHRYLAEATFRWNTRKLSDGARRDLAIAQSEGKRLMLARPKAAA